jgi:hypothetical protein
MGLWSRVFGRGDAVPEPAALVAALAGAPVATDFRGDAEGWFAAEIGFAAGSPLVVERFLATEEGIRAELNSWAAYLETCDYSPHAAALMERMIQTRQLFTLRRPLDAADDVLVEKVVVALCRALASAADGVYQIDDAGFFAADGSLLVQEY